MINFNADLSVVGRVLDKNPTIAEIAGEPSLFSCSLPEARRMGGPLVQKILDNIDLSREDIRAAFEYALTPVIDVRVQRLMPGMYPSIPGWHCDAVPRKDYNSQPDFDLLHPASMHLTCVLSTADDVSNTEFIAQPFGMTFNDEEPIWKQLHKHIEANNMTSKVIKPGWIYKFSSLTPHRAVATVTRGWRIFFRFSMYHNPPIQNKVPAAQQVYLLSEENGW